MNTPLKSTALAAAAAALLGGAGAARAADYANVVSATPVTSSVAVPRQQCFEGQRVVPSQPSGGGALVGAILGGVVGNQFGHGAGRAAATGLGIVAGSAIGNRAELDNNPGQVVPVRDCRTVSAYENRVVGYDVVYEYHGQRYTTRTATDPGPRLAIDVRPAAGAPLDNVGPRGGYSAVPPAYTEPSYDEGPPATYYGAGPAPVYYPAPAYYYGPPRAYYGPPLIGIGFSTGWGWRHGYRHW
jgi:uncharacterized protein YcfJ